MHKAMNFLADHTLRAVAYVSALGDSCCGVAWLDVCVVPRLKCSYCFKILRCNV